MTWIRTPLPLTHQKPRCRFFAETDARKAQKKPAVEQSLAYLARREHTRGELERKLRNKGYPGAEVAEALATLENNALLSHRRFMDEYIRNAERKGYGPVKIRWELKHGKQLEESEIDEAMCEIETDWVVSARRCCEKKFGAQPAGDGKERSRRQAYLFRRGFPADIVHQALDENPTSD